MSGTQKLAAIPCHSLDDRREDAWDTLFRPMIARVQARLDRIDVDLSVERLVERLLQTNNVDSHSGEGDFTSRRAECDSARRSPSFDFPCPLSSNVPGKEMKFVIHVAAKTCVGHPIIVFRWRGRQVWARHLPSSIARERQGSAQGLNRSRGRGGEREPREIKGEGRREEQSLSQDHGVQPMRDRSFRYARQTHQPAASALDR